MTNEKQPPEPGLALAAQQAARVRSRAQGKALWDLKRLHEAEYVRLYEKRVESEWTAENERTRGASE